MYSITLELTEEEALILLKTRIESNTLCFKIAKAFQETSWMAVNGEMFHYVNNILTLKNEYTKEQPKNTLGYYGLYGDGVTPYN